VISDLYLYDIYVLHFLQPFPGLVKPNLVPTHHVCLEVTDIWIDMNERLDRVDEAIRLVGWPKLVIFFFFMKDMETFQNLPLFLFQAGQSVCCSRLHASIKLIEN